MTKGYMVSDCNLNRRGNWCGWSVWLLLAVILVNPAHGIEQEFRLAGFSVDVTIPLNHRCMGVLPIKSQRVLDPLFVHGLVLLGAGQPIVLTAVDWCELRNGAYDHWRDALAEAAQTTRERVLLSALHQHDAPVVDRGAADLLSDVGLKGELYDEAFYDQVVRRVAAALHDAIPNAQPITHLGLGEAPVVDVASNRRVLTPDRRVSFARGSRSGADPFHRDAPAGLIDPNLKTLSFWNGKRPVLALHAYATHPMSHYGQGKVSADFVGLARQLRQRDDPTVKQIYVSGCSGDVTAGKYNDGSPANRAVLAERVYQAMVQAWESQRRVPLQQLEFRIAKMELEFHPKPGLSETSLRDVLHDADVRVEERILAAMGLASRMRVAAGQPIDLPCIDFGPAQIVLFPGESFVAYQLQAQQMRPESFVVSIGYGECWPGYIPTDDAFADGFDDNWLWVAPGSERRMLTALRHVLVPADSR